MKRHAAFLTADCSTVEPTVLPVVMFDEMDVMSRLQTNQGAQKAQWPLRLGDSLWVLQRQALASSFADGFDASPG